MPPITQAEWAPAQAFIRNMNQAHNTAAEIHTALVQQFPLLQPTVKQLQRQMAHWGLRSHGRIGAMTYQDGRPKPASEWPAAELRRILGFTYATWRSAKAYFRVIATELNIVRKSLTAPFVWGHARDRLVAEHAMVAMSMARPGTQAEQEAREKALDGLMRSMAK